MERINIEDIPFGTDHPIEEKLKWARRIFVALGSRLLEDRHVMELLNSYHQAIDQTWQVMKAAGVVAECTRCALEDGGSCCGSGIENKFDVVNLLINLLMGVELPEAPWDPTGCWFLGEKGCLIRARHVICVNFMCKRLYAALDDESVKEVQRAMERETEQAFILEEYIKVWLVRHGKE